MPELKVRLRVGRRRLPALEVPGELFEIYQVKLGPMATLVWLNLWWWAHRPLDGDDEGKMEALLMNKLQVGPSELGGLFQVLADSGLLEIAADGAMVIHEPGTAANDRPNKDQAPTANGVAAEKSLTVDAIEAVEVDGESGDTGRVERDMEAVIQMYHKNIGMIGPAQLGKLQFWVEEQKMSGEVMACAILETVRSAKQPRINYLEGVLRNWHNDGIRNLEDLRRSPYGAKVLGRPDNSGPEEDVPVHEGMPNAVAYRRVDPDMVNKWKELYPDEYDEEA